MATKLGQVVTHSEGLPHIKSSKLLNKREAKPLYLHYHNAYGHKTYKGGDMSRGTTTRKFAWPLNKVVMRGHLKN